MIKHHDCPDYFGNLLEHLGIFLGETRSVSLLWTFTAFLHFLHTFHIHTIVWIPTSELQHTLKMCSAMLC